MLLKGFQLRIPVRIVNIMWDRKACGVCYGNFAVHPKAKTVLTRQLCSPCRKVRRWKYAMEKKENK